MLAGTTFAFLASIVGRVLGTGRDSLERLSWLRLGLLGPKDHLDVAIEDGACALHCRVGLYTLVYIFVCVCMYEVGEGVL